MSQKNIVNLSELLSLDRHCKDLMVEMVPAIDVDATVTCPDQLRLLNANIRQVLSCFDRPKFIHLGPAITSLVTAALDTGGGGGFDSLIPCDNVQDTTWIFCANSYQGSMSPPVDVPLNSVALQYGFKVRWKNGFKVGVVRWKKWGFFFMPIKTKFSQENTTSSLLSRWY